MNICIVGLGYVGTALFDALKPYHTMCSYDPYKKIDVGGNEYDLETRWLPPAEVYIITVPTPVDCHMTPSLDALEEAILQVMHHGSEDHTMIIESTVAPGTCRNLVEDSRQFLNMTPNAPINTAHWGYSPERVSEGDWNITKNIKLIASDTGVGLGKMFLVYSPAFRVHGVNRVETAEAAKMLENTQRDTLIALANEFYMYCEAIGIDTQEVIEAAATKENFMYVKPGLVGGSCIGVDPYYLLESMREQRLYSKVVRAARETNEGMVSYIADQCIRRANEVHYFPRRPHKILLVGTGFKPNSDVTDNAKATELAQCLQKRGAYVTHLSGRATMTSINTYPLNYLSRYDLVIIAVEDDCTAHLTGVYRPFRRDTDDLVS